MTFIVKGHVMNLLEASDQDVIDFGRQLFKKHHNQCDSFEDASQNIVTDLFNDLKDDEDNSIFALIRIFRLSYEYQLPPEENASRPGYWLTLAGTYGLETNWQDRLKSSGHRIISPQAFETPMLKATFEQLNIEVGKLSDGEQIPLTKYSQDINDNIAQNFYVENVLGDERVVDQETFVKPYDIQSVVGLGGVFISGSFFACIGFTKQRISSDIARRFTKLTNFIATILASYDGKNLIWSGKQIN